MRHRCILSILSGLLFFLVFPAYSYSQTGTIKGKIVDAQTNEPLIGASVLIEGTTHGAAADLDGNYIIRNVEAGSYTLIASYVAYQSKTKTGVVVGTNNEITIDFLLNPDDISLQEVEVVARANRESENILLMEQRQALVATQAVGARELSRKGIGDAQAAVAQISGISRQEGVKNVFVRGLGDRYNVTLLNGFAIPSEDPQYKNIALEFFGTDIIQNISVSKVFSGSDYSDVGGASINIISKELVGDRALSVDFSGGVNTAAAGTDFLRQDGSGYFGFANNTRPSDNQYNFPNSLNPKEISMPLNHSYGISGGKSFRLGENNNPFSFFVVASHSTDYSYTEEIVRNTTTDGTIWQDQTGDKFSQNTNQLVLANALLGLNRKHNLQYNFMLVHANDQYVGEYSGYNSERHQGSPTYMGFSRRQQTNDNLLVVNQLLSDWALTGSLKLDVGVSYNTIKGLEPDRRENYFSLKEDNLYDLTRSNRNKRFFSDLKNNDVNARAALVLKLKNRFGTDNSHLKIGYNGRFVDDKFKAIEYNFSPLGMPSLSLENLDMDELFRQNLANGLLTMAVGDPNSYHVTKQIHSAFAEASYPLSRALTGNIGFRMDRVDLTVEHHVTHVAPGKEAIRKNYFLPSLNLKYDLNDKNSVRLGASKTYTLPQSKEISPYQYVNISFTDQGNPDLKPSDNYNIDLKWDYYMSPGELLSVTGFFKYIVDPIGRVDQGNSAGLLTYDNISDHALVGGVELELRKNIFSRFNTEREQMNRLSAGLNASYIYTNLRLDVLNTNPRDTELEGASPFLANFDLSYNYAKREKSFVASLIFNYFSDRIHTIGARGFNDIIEEGVPTLDFASSYNFNTHFSLKLRAANLLNASYRLSRESSTANEKVVLNEFRKGRNISLGVSYQF
ncbi:MAG: TonB-dependent receptor [Proteiniphilum sp.]|uniref:TonB-dependent receptor n=1 Tax=Proteiniphilum sp. TaxID=1926877 RepID=UPI002B1F5BCD|nr:TonB-dependent receptor [Proteiniphilum sp.]MEA5129611.1 TonB-dependent receptor [Proteiniphilum sp.]